MSRKSKNIGFIRKSVAIVVDGETEMFYLQMLKKFEENRRKREGSTDIRINIMPKLPNKRSIDKQYHEVCDLAGEYTYVFWIVDYDQVAKEQHEWNKQDESPIEKFKKYRDKINKLENATVLINNPCLEFWFLLHYKNTSKRFSACIDAERDLREHIKDYEKTQKYFKNQRNDIYSKLNPYLEDAIINAKKLGVFNENNPNKALAEIYKLFEMDVLNLGYKAF